MVDWRTKENAEFGEFFQNASTDFSISYWLAWGEDGCCVIDFDTVSQQLESLWWLHLHQSLACHYGLKHACQIGTKLLLNMNKHGNECYIHINIHTHIFYSGLVQSIKSVCSENGTAFVAVACSESLKWGGWKKLSLYSRCLFSDIDVCSSYVWCLHSFQVNTHRTINKQPIV